MTPGARATARRRGEAAEELAARFLASAGPRDRGAQLPHAASGRSTSSRATARRSCSSRCGCARGAPSAAPPGASTRRKQRRIVAAARHYLARLRAEPRVPVRCPYPPGTAGRARRGSAAPSTPPRLQCPRPQAPKSALHGPRRHVRSHFQDAIALKQRMSETLAPAIARAGEALAEALRARPQGARLRQRRLGRRLPAFRGRAGRPLRARAPGPARDRAHGRHLRPHRDRQRLLATTPCSPSRSRRWAARATSCSRSPPPATRRT